MNTPNVLVIGRDAAPVAMLRERLNELAVSASSYAARHFEWLAIPGIMSRWSKDFDLMIILHSRLYSSAENCIVYDNNLDFRILQRFPETVNQRYPKTRVVLVTGNDKMLHNMASKGSYFAVLHELPENLFDLVISAAAPEAAAHQTV